MDRKKQDIAILNDFRITLQVRNFHHRQTDRSKLNQLMPKIRKILYATNTIRYVNIDADGQKPRARQNVVFEHGFMCAHLGRAHVCALLERGVEQPGVFQGKI